MKFCKNCGAQMPPESKFCALCGTKQDDLQDGGSQQTSNQSSFQSNVNGNQAAVKKIIKPIHVIIPIIVAVIVAAGYIFFTSKYFTFAMIKRNPLGAFTKAVENQQDLKSYSSNVKISGKLSTEDEQFEISSNIDSNVNVSKKQAVCNCTLDLKSGDQTKTVTGNLYQDADKFYLKLPVLDKYIRFEAKNNSQSNNTNEVTKRAVEKALDAVKNKISNSDLETSEETIQINNEKCDVIKIHFKLDKEKVSDICKAAIVNIMEDNKFKNYMKSFYEGNDFDNEYDRSIREIKDADMNEGLKDINVPKLSLDAYVDKNNNLVGIKIETNIEPSDKNEKGSFSLSLKQSISKINEVDNVNLPSDLSANSKNIEEFINDASYEDKIDSYFDFGQIARAKEQSEILGFKVNAKCIQKALEQCYAEYDRYPYDDNEFQSCMQKYLGSVPKYSDSTEMVNQYTGNAYNYNVTFNDDKNTSIDESEFSIDKNTDLDATDNPQSITTDTDDTYNNTDSDIYNNSGSGDTNDDTGSDTDSTSQI